MQNATIRKLRQYGDGNGELDRVGDDFLLQQGLLILNVSPANRHRGDVEK